MKRATSPSASRIHKSLRKRANSIEFDELEPAAARAIMRMRLSAPDLARVRRLSEAASEGDLSTTERRELKLYLQVGHVISLMRSEARLALQRLGPPTRRKG